MKNELFRRSLAPFLAAAISVAALAQQPTRITPSAERLRAHITYLASDPLQGRRTGTPGANDAAHYIAGEFSQMGLKPAFQTIRSPRNRGEARSNYRQNFPYVAGLTLGTGNELTFKEPSGGTNSLRVGDDWMPLGLSTNSRIENTNAAFVGYGITAAELKYDDYAGAEATGKIALALAGTPDGDNPHGQFARFEDVRWKAIAARNAGAKALIVIAREENFKQDRLSALRYDNSAGDSGLPVAVISRQSAAKLLGFESTEVLARMERTVSSWVLGGGPSANCKEPCGVTHNFKLPISFGVTLTTDLTRREVVAANVVGILEGSNPTLKNEAIIIGAHYDHLGRGGSGSLAPREGEVHHGADDNASGTAGILELARALTSQRPKPRRTIVFIAFGGEEEGLLGSNYYVNHPVVPLANTVAMINLDMIGRLKNKNLIIGGVGTAPEWRPMIESANLWQGMTVTAAGSSDQNGGGAAAHGVPIVVAANGRTVVTSDSSRVFQLTLNEDGFGPSDHSSFYAKQIPVLFFWTGTHEDYHKPSDTADKINYDGEARILSMVGRIVRDVDESDKRPTYTAAKTEATGRAIGFRVYLGTIPNYADSNEGLLLDGVRDDSPAAKAGLKAGDRIVKLAGRDVRNVYDYTAALGEMKAGQEYEVEIVRGAERVTLKLTPAAKRP
jgi:hypothetical protein